MKKTLLLVVFAAATIAGFAQNDKKETKEPDRSAGLRKIASGRGEEQVRREVEESVSEAMEDLKDLQIKVNGLDINIDLSALKQLEHLDEDIERDIERSLEGLDEEIERDVERSLESLKHLDLDFDFDIDMDMDIDIDHDRNFDNDNDHGDIVRFRREALRDDTKSEIKKETKTDVKTDVKADKKKSPKKKD